MKTISMLLWLLFVLAVLTFAISMAFGQSRSSTETPTVIGEKNTLISWGVVLVLLAACATAVTAIAQSKVHIANGDIHCTLSSLQQRFAAKEDCIARHLEIRDSFTRVHQRLDDMSRQMAERDTKIADDLGFIRGKLEKV